MKVAVAVEDSQYSQDVIHELTKRRWPKDTDFKVLTVVEPLEHLIPTNTAGADLCRATQAYRHHAAEKMCAEFRQQIIKGVANSIVHFEVREGHIKDEILKAAAAWGADKIILGANTGLTTRAQSTGSTCRTVADHAHCGVEIIVPPSRRQAKKEHSLMALK
jgi:nucleotide-binding universal stress UspA family protein